MGHGDWVYAALYVFVEVVGALTIIQFWTLANDIFNARDAKRLFGTIGAGGTIANILVGGAVGALAKSVGTENLIFLSTALLVVVSVLALRFGHSVPKRVAKKSRVRSPGVAEVFGSTHLKLVAGLSAITFLATTTLDFQFKVIAAQTFQKDALTSFFGAFYAATGFLAMLVQFFVSARVLSRFGVVVALGILPSFLGLGSVTVMLFPVLWAATLAKGSEFVFRYTINDSTTQLLYLPVPANIRAGAKGFIDGVIKPGSIAVSGLALTLYKSHVGTALAPIGAASAVCCALWGLMVLNLRGQYVRSLQDTLRKRRLDLPGAAKGITDSATGGVLARALESDVPQEVMNALELLPHTAGVNLDNQVLKLLTNPSPEVRTAALKHFARYPSLRWGNAVFRKFDDPDPKVRASAIEAFCAVGRDKSVKSVRAFLKDPDPAVRAAAIIGIVRYGGLDGVLAAGEALKALIAEPSWEMREHGARVLGAIGVKNFYQPLLELMVDKHVAVRRAAIASAGSLKATECLTALVYRLGKDDTASEAIQALASYGSAVESVLSRVLDNRLEDPTMRRNVPRVLGRLETPGAVQVLSAHLWDPDETVRKNLYRALARVLRHRRGLGVDRRAVQRAIDHELARAYHALHCLEGLKLSGPLGSSAPRDGTAAAEALLASALMEKVDQCEARVFTLLGILYPDAEVELIYAGYKDALAQDAARKRANALELLDNLLDRPLKGKLFPLIEDRPREAKLREAEEVYPPPTGGSLERMGELLQDESAWVRACALHLAGERRDATLTKAVRDNLEHVWQVVREESVVALSKMLPLDELALAVETRQRDEAEPVRTRVEAILAGELPGTEEASHG
jgi:HEAT repeat protein